jgi:hypothetical protein
MKTYIKPEIMVVKLQLQSALLQASSVTSIGGNADFDPSIMGSNGDARTRESNFFDEW